MTCGEEGGGGGNVKGGGADVQGGGGAQDMQKAQGFVLGRLQEQAVQLGADATAMPSRVAKLDR